MQRVLDLPTALLLILVAAVTVQGVSEPQSRSECERDLSALRSGRPPHAALDTGTLCAFAIRSDHQMSAHTQSDVGSSASRSCNYVCVTNQSCSPHADNVSLYELLLVLYELSLLCSKCAHSVKELIIIKACSGSAFGICCSCHFCKRFQLLLGNLKCGTYGCLLQDHGLKSSLSGQQVPSASAARSSVFT